MLGLESLLSDSKNLGLTIAIHASDGKTTSLGEGTPDFEVFVRNDAGQRALYSLGELEISEAYVRGDIDVGGDLVRALATMRDLLSDDNLWIKTWRWVKPLFLGRTRLNPQWIAKHYDAKNIQLYAQDRDYHTYTPGLYDGDDDTMEAGAVRKLQFAFDQLGLAEGHRLLEVGCGWGGFTRFCARRKVKVLGITLSRDQQEFTAGKLKEEALDAEARYQDFFTFEPSEPFDGISMMGVIEDLSDYPKVLDRISRWVKPGGRVYLDFASSVLRFGTSTFITKYVWPGTFRMVFLPELVEAITQSRMEIVGLHNDRRNYHLWAKKGHARWLEDKEKIVAQSSIETWRLFRILFAGTSAVMDSASHEVSAHRLILERPRLLSFKRPG